MSLSMAVIDVLEDLLDEQLPPRMREALERIEAAERAGLVRASPASPATVGDTSRDARQPSKAALRTRKWRARKAEAAGLSADGGQMVEPVRNPHELAAAVTAEASPDRHAERHAPSPKASPVTVGDGGGDGAGQKKVFPHTPFQRKTTPTQKGFPNRRKRHRSDGDVGEGQPVAPTVFLDAHDARYRELVVMRGRSFPIHSGGWWFPADSVAEAEARIAAKVRPLRPVAGSAALAAATGPPGRAAGSG